MSAKVRVTLEHAWFSAMDDNTGIPVTLTEKQAQLLASVSYLLINRYAWDDMTDAQWDDLQATVAVAIGVVSIP